MTKIDERTFNNWRSWYQRQEPGADTEHAWYHSSAESAIKHVRKSGPSAKIRLCPLSTEGKEEAEEAARNDANVEVSDFQIWISPIGYVNNKWADNPWRIRRSGRGTSNGTRSSRAQSAAAAIAQVQKQAPNAAIRLPTGNAEAQVAAEESQIGKQNQPLDVELVNWSGPGD